MQTACHSFCTLFTKTGIYKSGGGGTENRQQKGHAPVDSVGWMMFLSNLLLILTSGQALKKNLNLTAIPFFMVSVALCWNLFWPEHAAKQVSFTTQQRLVRSM